MLGIRRGKKYGKLNKLGIGRSKDPAAEAVPLTCGSLRAARKDLSELALFRRTAIFFEMPTVGVTIALPVSHMDAL
jgi:hypothetical protein